MKRKYSKKDLKGYFGKKDFKPHMMYDKSGRGYMAETFEDHMRMKKMGYVHKKSKKPKYKMKKMKSDSMGY